VKGVDPDISWLIMATVSRVAIAVLRATRNPNLAKVLMVTDGLSDQKDD
jgi:hypothetical protein